MQIITKYGGSFMIFYVEGHSNSCELNKYIPFLKSFISTFSSQTLEVPDIILSFVAFLKQSKEAFRTKSRHSPSLSVLISEMQFLCWGKFWIWIWKKKKQRHSKSTFKKFSFLLIVIFNIFNWICTVPLYRM